MRKANENQPVETEKFLQSILILSGLKRGKDFILKHKQLRIIKNPIRGKVLSLVKEHCPEYSYYWETPHILRWF